MNNDLISRSALKKEFQKLFWATYAIEKITDIIDNAQTIDTTCPNCDSGYAQGYSDGYLKGKEERPQEWIPVSERLPPQNGVYNVTRKLKEGETIYFISDASYFDGQNTWHRDVCVNHGRPYLNDVVAWMPRPEPYKEVGTDNGN